MNYDAILSVFSIEFEDVSPPLRVARSRDGRMHCWWRRIYAVLSERVEEFVLQVNLADGLQPPQVTERFNDCSRFTKGPYKYDEERFATMTAALLRSYDKERDNLQFLDDPDFGWLMTDDGPDSSLVCWSGIACLEFFARREVTIRIESDARGPNPEQRLWFREFASRQASLRTEVEAQAFRYYQEWRRDVGCDTPDLTRSSDVWSHLDPASMTLRGGQREPGSPMVVEFHWGCSWDDEHGCSATLEDWRFTEFGEG